MLYMIRDSQSVKPYRPRTTRPPIRRTSKASGQSLLIGAPQVGALIGRSSRTVYRLADAGELPAPMKGKGHLQWSRRDIELWVACGCSMSQFRQLKKGE